MKFVIAVCGVAKAPKKQDLPGCFVALYCAFCAFCAFCVAVIGADPESG